MTLNGNMKFLKNFEIDKNLKINGNVIQIGLNDTNLRTYDINLNANGRKLGLNKSNPEYTLDINSDQINGFNIISYQAGKGISVTTNGTNSSINFFIDSSMQSTNLSDGIITYSTGGNMSVVAPKNVFFKFQS